MLRWHLALLHLLLQAQDTHARKTKIVCTLGPACWSEEGLAELLDAGMNVARFNFSHGDHEGHFKVRLGGAPTVFHSSESQWSAGAPHI